MPGSFFDTNVLVYLASDNLLKANRAEEVISGGGTISVQVLNELANVARRKMRMSWTETAAFLSVLRDLLAVRPLMVETQEAGFRAGRALQFLDVRCDDRGVCDRRRLRYAVV